MKRSSLYPFVIVLGVILTIIGCASDNGKSLQLSDLLPYGSNDAVGWQEDLDHAENIPGPETTTCVARENENQADCATDWVNGAIGPISATGEWAGLAREYYIKDTWKITVFIYEMTNIQATDIVYDEIAGHIAMIVDITLGQGETKARMGNVPTFWAVHAVKDRFVIEAQLLPKCAEGCDLALQEFTKAVLKRIP